MTRALLARTLLVFFLSAPVVAAQAPAPTPQNLTLAEAVRLALEKNPTVQAADAYARSVQEGIGEAKAARAEARQPVWWGCGPESTAQE
ncbi:MAG: hypothetical protein ABSA41_02285 [Terriglobia bacterium]|jgi:outer membrane protein TolC